MEQAVLWSVAYILSSIVCLLFLSVSLVDCGQRLRLFLVIFIIFLLKIMHEYPDEKILNPNIYIYIYALIIFIL